MFLILSHSNPDFIYVFILFYLRKRPFGIQHLFSDLAIQEE